MGLRRFIYFFLIIFSFGIMIFSNSFSTQQSNSFYIKPVIRDLSGKTTAAFNVDYDLSSGDTLIYEKPKEDEHSESYIKNTTLFQGRELDYETGLYYFRNRHFNPDLGRFMQADPLGYHDSMNLYQSFGNNPVNFSDPMGTLSLKKLLLHAAQGAANMLLGIAEANPFEVNPISKRMHTRINITENSKPFISQELDTRSQGEINKENLLNMTLLYPTGKLLGEFSGDVYNGWFMNASQEVKDEFQAEAAEEAIPLGVALYTTGKAIKVGLSSYRSYNSPIRKLSRSIPKDKPVVVLGENMKGRVNPIADQLRNLGYDVKTYNPKKFTGLNKNTLEANRSWLRYWIKEQNATVIDIGREAGRLSPSPFYSMEERSLYENWKYTNVFKFDPGN